MSEKKILTLHLKGKWWDQIARGEKTCELRRCTEYWRKRLVGVVYDEVHLWRGYPKSTETDKRLIRKWEILARETIVHEEFGPDPVDVYVIGFSNTAAR